MRAVWRLELPGIGCGYKNKGTLEATNLPFHECLGQQPQSFPGPGSGQGRSRSSGWESAFFTPFFSLLLPWFLSCTVRSVVLLPLDVPVSCTELRQEVTRGRQRSPSWSSAETGFNWGCTDEPGSAASLAQPAAGTMDIPSRTSCQLSGRERAVL